MSTAYIAASTNRFCQAADASSASLIAFGSANLVCLWDIAVRDTRFMLQYAIDSDILPRQILIQVLTKRYQVMKEL